MANKATSVAEYLKGLPEDRREAIETVRAVILKNLDKGYAETIQYGMIGYCVPHSVFPQGYHCDPKQPLPFAGMASQKGHMSLYMFGLYTSPEMAEWFQKAWAKTGKKLDMGKSCIRFKKLEDVPLDVIGEAIRRMPTQKFIEGYLAAFGDRAKPSAKRSAPQKATASKKTAKKSGKKAAKTSR